ncbi:MAG: tetratricopeptide repeat protein [Planctomycetota bacterium]|jgi:TolA-binding protein
MEEFTVPAARAKAFFERAQQAAESDSFDYAIDMYMEGLRCVPDELEAGHLKLYAFALHRQGKGGKRPSMIEKVKRLYGKKSPLQKMLAAEYLFAKDPDNLVYMEAMLKGAIAGGYDRAAKWMADLAFQTNNASSKPSLRTYLFLKDSYAAIGEYERAIAACHRAMMMKPEDEELEDEFKRLSAEMTVAKGKYDSVADFRESIDDLQAQEELQAQRGVVKADDYRLKAVEGARKSFAKDPDLLENIFNLAQRLSDMENDECENEAIKLLKTAYETRKDFSFEQRAGRIRIKQLKRKIREAKKSVESKAGDAQACSRLSELSNELKSFEMEHYRLFVLNYPTDPHGKYEYGIRLLSDKRYDEAIPLLQDAQRDPRYKIAAMGKIGLCFFLKGWFTDAADLFAQAINSYEIKDDGVAKELRYNLACTYEEQGDSGKALEIYRKLAQLDFEYRDVRQRVDKLRNEKNETTS